MDQRKIALLVTLATVLTNCVLIFSGATESISCEVKHTATELTATAYAAFAERN